MYKLSNTSMNKQNHKVQGSFQRCQYKSIPSQQHTFPNLHALRKQFQNIKNRITPHSSLPSAISLTLHPSRNTSPFISSKHCESNDPATVIREFEEIMKQISQMTVQWNHQLQSLSEKVEIVERRIQKVQFQRHNNEMLRNIAEFKSSNILLEKINCLESQDIENKLNIKKLINEVMAKNDCLKNITISFEEAREELRKTKEELRKFQQRALTKEETMDVERLVGRFNQIKLQSYTQQ